MYYGLLKWTVKLLKLLAFLIVYFSVLRNSFCVKLYFCTALLKMKSSSLYVGFLISLQVKL